MKGTRVRIDAPGYRFHGRIVTVEFDMNEPDGLCVAKDERGRRHTLAGHETVRVGRAR